MSGYEVDVDTVQVKEDDELSNSTSIDALLVDVDATGTEAKAFV